jgi:hypothetical protein
LPHLTSAFSTVSNFIPREGAWGDSDTRAKLEASAKSEDYETRMIAERALNGHPFDEEYDSCYDSDDSSDGDVDYEDSGHFWGDLPYDGDYEEPWTEEDYRIMARG